MARFLAFLLLAASACVAAAAPAVTGPGAVPGMAAPTGAMAAQSQRTWWDDTPWLDPERGFHWYPDPAAPKPEKKAEEKKDPPKTIYQMTNFEDINKELKRLREDAILNPTEKRIHEYLKAQQWIMDKSAVFADTARRVVWANPDVDYNGKSPVVNAARFSEGQRAQTKRDRYVTNLADTHGIVFFARSDCPYCHDQAPILKIVERNFRMPVLAISMDGGAIPGYPDAKRDNGISARVTNGEGITTVPAIFLVHRKTMQAVPLGTGVIAADDLAERIRVLTSTEPGEEF